MINCGPGALSSGDAHSSSSLEMSLTNFYSSEGRKAPNVLIATLCIALL